MIPTRHQVGLALFLLTLSSPQGIFAWDSSLSAGRFLCESSTAHHGRGPDWLVKQGEVGGGTGTPLLLRRAECGYATLTAPTMRFSGIVQGDSGRTTLAVQTSGWKQVGIVGLEFGGASVASAAGVVGAYWAATTLTRKGDVYYVPAVAIGYGGYALSSIVLSAAGTHLMGKLLGRGESFGHALAGGAIGAVAGGGVLVAFITSNRRTGGRCWPLLPVGLALPAVGSVISYNVWRNK